MEKDIIISLVIRKLLSLAIIYQPLLFLLWERFPKCRAHKDLGGAGNRGRGYYTWIKVRICEDDFTVAMKADSASHLLRQPINFELFLFVYLVCALILQIINIYKNVRYAYGVH